MFHADSSDNVAAHTFSYQPSTVESALLELHFWNSCSLSIACCKDESNSNYSLLFHCYLDLISPALIYYYSTLSCFSRLICHLSFQFNTYPPQMKSGIQSPFSLFAKGECVFIHQRSTALSGFSSKYCFSLKTENVYLNFLFADSIVFFAWFIGAGLLCLRF